MSVPAVVPVQQAFVAAEEIFLRVEDDDVGNGRDDEEEGHLQLQTHPQKHATGNQCQYTIIYRILERQNHTENKWVIFVQFFFPSRRYNTLKISNKGYDTSSFTQMTNKYSK